MNIPINTSMAATYMKKLQATTNPSNCSFRIVRISPDISNRTIQMNKSIVRKVGEKEDSNSRLVRASLPASFKNVQAIAIYADK